MSNIAGAEYASEIVNRAQLANSADDVRSITLKSLLTRRT